jgi:hypothetical protein
MRVAIGGWNNNGNGVASGHVRMYEWKQIDSTWNQIGFAIDGEAADDQSGQSVFLSADVMRLAIGSDFND